MGVRISDYIACFFFFVGIRNSEYFSLPFLGTLNENKMLKYNRLFVASHHADVLKGSSRVRGAGTRDEPLRTSAWEATLVDA